jgi:hypothetical protein
MIEKTDIYDLLYYKIIREQVVARLNRSIIPIYDQSNKELIGTGVLLQYNENYFIITANHVLNDNDDNICLYFSDINKYGVLYGKKLEHEFDFGQRDIIDICIVKLDDALYYPYLLSNFNFIDLSYIQVNHNLVFEDIYTVIGFPNEKMNGSFTYLTRPLSNINYEDLGYNNRFHIVLEYDKIGMTLFTKLSDNRYEVAQVPGINLHCMSGSGVWYIPYQYSSNKENIVFYLVGILTEYQEDKKAIGITKIDFITELLRKCFNLHFPETKMYDQDI